MPETRPTMTRGSQACVLVGGDEKTMDLGDRTLPQEPKESAGHDGSREQYRPPKEPILIDAFVQAEGRIGVVASRGVEHRSNAGWSCHSTA